MGLESFVKLRRDAEFRPVHAQGSLSLLRQHGELKRESAADAANSVLRHGWRWWWLNDPADESSDGSDNSDDSASDARHDAADGLTDGASELGHCVWCLRAGHCDRQR